LGLGYSFLLALEIELVVLNIVRGIRVRRETGARFTEVLVRHNVLYYVCGMVFTIINVTTGILGNYGNVAIFEDLQIYMHATLSTRMHRTLWFDSEHEFEGPDDPVVSVESE